VNDWLKNTRDGLAGFFTLIMPHIEDIRGNKEQFHGIALKSENNADW
jgi:hypothetical protein